MVMLRRPTLRSLQLSPSQRTTASPTLITSRNLLRKNLPLALGFPKLASLMKEASKIRNGPTPSLFLRRKKKTLLLVLEERPSVNVSASRSNFLKSISASSRHPSVDEVDSVVAEAVATDLLEAAEVMDSVVDAVVKVGAVALVATTEVAVVLLAQEAAPQLLLSTPKTPVLSPASGHRSRQKSLKIFILLVRILYDASLRTNDRASEWVQTR
jgi:hypothetical protein